MSAARRGPEQLREGKKAHSLVPLPQAVAVRVDAVQRAAQAVRRDAAQLGDEQTPASQGELFQKTNLLQGEMMVSHYFFFLPSRTTPPRETAASAIAAKTVVVSPVSGLYLSGCSVVGVSVSSGTSTSVVGLSFTGASGSGSQSSSSSGRGGMDGQESGQGQDQGLDLGRGLALERLAVPAR